MIPYIKVPDLPLLGLKLHPFGMLVATGVIVGTTITTRRAMARGYDLEKLNSFVTWMLVAGFLGGHMLDQIFYHPAELVHRPWSLFMLWEGLSSFGGFTGALIGIVLWKYFDAKPWLNLFVVTIPKFFRRPTPEPLLPFADLVLAVFPVAWIFGRSGCSVVHDHPGARAPAGTWFAVEYGRGPVTKFGPIEFVHGDTLTYDLGFLELLFTIVLAFLIALTWRKRLPCGTYVVVTSLAYAPVRFAMDFLRIRDTEASDPRYGGLTPAQWACVALFGFGLVMLKVVLDLRKRNIDPRSRVMAPGLAQAPLS